MATTIKQVATAAGVSVATASRALSGSNIVVEATIRRVHAAAAELQFTPSRLAKSLATGTTGNIGVVLPDVTNPFYTTFLAALEATATANDLGILIGDSHESVDLEWLLVQRMSTQVDALVLASSRLADTAIVQVTARLPVVLANRRLDDPIPCPENLSQVVIDVGPGFAAAVRHLGNFGHRRIAYVDGPPASWSGRRKRAVLESECSVLGFELAVVATTGRPDFSTGRLAATDALDTGATAVMVFNDQMALGLLAGLRERGIRVPGDVSVIGCDDSLADGMAWPSLTTVDSSSHTLGILAAEALLQPSSGDAVRVPTRLIVRGSTAAAEHPPS